MNHLMNIIDGIASVFDLAPRESKYPIRKNGFSMDQKRLQGDVEKLSGDMRKVLKKHGKQFNKSSF